MRVSVFAAVSECVAARTLLLWRRLTDGDYVGLVSTCRRQHWSTMLPAHCCTPNKELKCANNLLRTDTKTNTHTTPFFLSHSQLQSYQ